MCDLNLSQRHSGPLEPTAFGILLGRAVCLEPLPGWKSECLAASDLVDRHTWARNLGVTKGMTAFQPKCVKQIPHLLPKCLKYAMLGQHFDAARFANSRVLANSKVGFCRSLYERYTRVPSLGTQSKRRDQPRKHASNSPPEQRHSPDRLLLCVRD